MIQKKNTFTEWNGLYLCHQSDFLNKLKYNTVPSLNSNAKQTFSTERINP